MDSKISEFLTKNRVSVVTTMLKDGTPHASTLHYSHSEDPLMFYFSTQNTSRKCEALMGGKPVLAAVVIGFSETEWLTMQMEGTIWIVPQDKLEEVQDIHYTKLPSSEKWKNDPTTVMLAFSPTWWRFTDLNTEPHKTISSK